MEGVEDSHSWGVARKRVTPFFITVKEIIMNISIDIIKNRIKLRNVIETLKMNKEYSKNVKPNGIIVFSGEQGSGKTLSAVQYCKALQEMYKDTQIITNVKTEFDNKTLYENIDTINYVYNKHKDSLIILFIDEITNEFNSLDSKEFNIAWFTIVNMMRKRNLVIVGTCPLFSRLSKAFREQFDTIILCSKGVLGICVRMDEYKNTFDGSEDTENGLSSLGVRFIRRKRLWIEPKFYTDYDTREIIETKRSDVKERSKRK